MRYAVAIAWASLSLCGVSAVASTLSPDPTGVWMRGDGNARVRIAPCGDDICATNLWIKDTSSGEAAGDKLVMSVKPTSDTILSGTAFDAKRNLTYSMRMTVEKVRLVTRGCVLGGVICKETDWSRAQE